MRKIFKIIKENFYVIILLLGVGLFTNSLFSFDSSYYTGITDNRPRRERLSSSTSIAYPIATYYYYDSTSLNNLTIGAILIVFGLIKIRTKKDKK